MLNRAALLCRYRQPFVDWINAADPSPSSSAVTLADVNAESNVYLVEVEDEGELARWLELNAQTVFENELNGWYQDPALWPRDRSPRVLQDWCALEFHAIVIDTGDTPIEDEDLDG